MILINQQSTRVVPTSLSINYCSFVLVLVCTVVVAMVIIKILLYYHTSADGDDDVDIGSALVKFQESILKLSDQPLYLRV